MLIIHNKSNNTFLCKRPSQPGDGEYDNIYFSNNLFEACCWRTFESCSAFRDKIGGQGYGDNLIISQSEELIKKLPHIRILQESDTYVLLHSSTRTSDNGYTKTVEVYGKDLIVIGLKIDHDVPYRSQVIITKRKCFKGITQEFFNQNNTWTTIYRGNYFFMPIYNYKTVSKFLNLEAKPADENEIEAFELVSRVPPDKEVNYILKVFGIIPHNYGKSDI